MAIAADLPGGAPPALNLPSLPAAPVKPPPRAELPPAQAAQAPDCSGTDVKAAAKFSTSSSLLDLLNLIPSIE
jgi:hypothetical protein